jgi:hypothetical protein
MFRPSRPSSGPSRTQNQALFSFPALWDPKCYKFQLQEQKVYKLVQTELALWKMHFKIRDLSDLVVY